MVNISWNRLLLYNEACWMRESTARQRVSDLAKVSVVETWEFNRAYLSEAYASIGRIVSRNESQRKRRKGTIYLLLSFST